MEHMGKLKRRRNLCTAAGILLTFLFMLLTARVHKGFLAAAFLTGIAASLIDRRIGRQIATLEWAWQQRQIVRIDEGATVLRRRVKHFYRPGRHGSVRAARDDWRITFRTRFDGDVEMSVPYDVFVAVKEGTSGRLKYQGTRFIYFDRR